MDAQASSRGSDGLGSDGPHSDGVEEAVAVLKAVADPTRFRLLWALSQQELPVGKLAELVGAHVAAVSQHLAKLRTAGLVASRRDGTRIFYRISGEHVRGLLEEVVVVAGSGGDESTGPGGSAPASATEPAPAARTLRWPRAVGLRPVRRST
ncbi:ArsR/SmtB family transcription factor [Streptantibioticus ferralitis]|uniref:Metalloregulator ArsR/SmtB family transcription factor n=1 Tax=Streptantibioticus ferralitis TaxID=236510 RepID=A0ABT5ZAV6_9ACTN|nr:metalloregulator ArsR/SmtB family transcription factor [Streptantibioticus ferralitis]MDF2260978.1 metalloregulator ArsR/SmtB family transcription factor [Streptantibioticus ferralitis]